MKFIAEKVNHNGSISAKNVDKAKNWVDMKIPIFQCWFFT